MIKDRIGRNGEVLLPINHNYNKICDVLAVLKKESLRNSKKFLRSVQLHRHDAHCPITLSY